MERARTNFVQVTDLLRLVNRLGNVEIELVGAPTRQGYVAFVSTTADGQWPKFLAPVEPEDGLGIVDVDDADRDQPAPAFEFGEHILPYIVQGEVLVVLTPGAPLMMALQRQGDTHQVAWGNDERIVQDASSYFGVAVDPYFAELPVEEESPSITPSM